MTSLDQLAAIVARYQAVTGPKVPDAVFLHYLTRARDCWFVEIEEVGLVFLTDIVPSFNAYAQVVFWDGEFRRARRACVGAILADAFTRFDLRRISAYVPRPHHALTELLRKLGFVVEGNMRDGGVIDGVYHDLILNGLMRTELTCPHLTISLA